MPPQDTLIRDSSVDSIQVHDPPFQTINNPITGTEAEQQHSFKSEEKDISWITLFLIVAFVLFFTYLTNWIEKLPGKIKIKRRIKQAGILEAERGSQYDDWLKKYNPYYNNLPVELRQRFLRRTIEFMQSKKFRFHSMEWEEYIPLLISGAAVQVTFGLKNYLMDYYSVINVISREYHIPQDDDLYFGHVSRKSICVSWNHFQQGFEDYTDSSNVGLHEMAHAVSFDVFLGQTDHHDHAFKKRLSIFQKKGIPIFRAMRQSSIRLLDDYGATNFDEFWAVCVVTFFENSEEFSRTMPDLYLSVAELLNQDPLKQGKILDKELAGLAN